MEHVTCLLVDFLFFLFGLLGLPVLLGLVLHLLERVTLRLWYSGLGFRGMLLTTGWIGVPIHEISHALLCPLFGHTIEKFAPFAPSETDGTLGYVRHSYNPKNPWARIGNFFIALAPLFGGGLAVLVLLHLLLPQVLPDLDRFRTGGVLGMDDLLSRLTILFQSSLELLQRLKDAASAGWRFWLFIFLAAGIATHAAPSPQDFKGALPGLLLFLAAAMIFFLILKLAAPAAYPFIYFRLQFITSYITALLALFLSIATINLCFVISLNSLIRVLRKHR